MPMQGGEGVGVAVVEAGEQKWGVFNAAKLARDLANCPKVGE